MPIQCDYHMHTPLCQHATGPMEAYVERAIELGLREVGFSDHNPLPNGFSANVRMKESELEYYVQRVIDLRFQYRGKIDVMLGLELDYVEGLEDYVTKQIAVYPWDYIIGSVHYLDRECRIGSWTKGYTGTVDEHYARYFTLVRQLAQSGLCDMLAHLDVVKRCTRPPTQRGLDEVSATLQAVAKAGVGIEINTSGYRHPELVNDPQPYPALPFVEQAIALGIPLAVNSDAHAPDQVGLKFAEIESFLKKHGCRKLVRFDRRKRESYAL
jgi:histidinol-phosphatase (PHP family)